MSYGRFGNLNSPKIYQFSVWNRQYLKNWKFIFQSFQHILYLNMNTSEFFLSIFLNHLTKNKKFVAGFAPNTLQQEAPPPGHGYFWIETHNQLVIGYHWLAFLNQVRKNLIKVPSSLEMLNTKTTISKKLKIEQKRTHELEHFQNITYLLGLGKKLKF